MTDINKQATQPDQKKENTGIEETQEELVKNLDIPHERFVDAETIELKDNEFLVEDKTEAELVERMIKNESKMPIEMMRKELKEHKTVSLELHRKPKTTEKGWVKAVGPALAFEDVRLGKMLSMGNKEIEGNIILYLVFEPTVTKPLTAKVTAKLVEYPDQKKGDLVNHGIVFTKTLNGKEFAQEEKI